jgi:hypothetical protein
VSKDMSRPRETAPRQTRRLACCLRWQVKCRNKAAGRDEREAEEKEEEEREEKGTLKKLFGFFLSSNMKTMRKMCLGASNSIFEAIIARPTCTNNECHR